jgi:hypothetical protein
MKSDGLYFGRFFDKLILSSYILLFTEKNRLGYILGDSFSNSSGHPFVQQQQFFVTNTSTQGCQSFLGAIYQKGKYIPNYHTIYKMSINISNGCKIDQMSIKYTSSFHCKTLPNLPKLRFLV